MEGLLRSRLGIDLALPDFTYLEVRLYVSLKKHIVLSKLSLPALLQYTAPTSVRINHSMTATPALPYQNPPYQ